METLASETFSPSVFETLSKGDVGDKAATETKKEKGEFNSWYKKAYGKVVNLGVSDMEALNFVASEMNNSKISATKKLALQQLVEGRSQFASLISQLLKIMSETSQAIIRNIR